MYSNNYILVTPAKNEEKSLPSVIDSVLNQTILPKLWVIVDDGSTDKTPEILDNFSKKYEWIKVVRLPKGLRDKYLHYAYVCRVGFETAIKYCEDNKILYDFVALLDADTILEEKYFEKLIDEFKKDPSLGIASGGIYYRKKKRLIYERTLNYPRGTGRIWSKKCFFETGGYPLDPCAHTISDVKAILRGYKIKQFKNVVAIQTRKTNSVEGLWRSYFKGGKNAYYLYKRPAIVLLNVLHNTFKPPFYTGIAYLLGYLSATIKRERRIQDPEVRDYFQNQKISDTIFEFFKSLVS